MAKRKKKNKKIKKWIKAHKVLVISIIVFIFLLFAIFGTKVWLYLNFLLGNDVVVKLDVDKRDIYLEHGQENNITFEAKVTTNPFCTAVCKYSFIDISKKILIEKDEFILRPRAPFKKKYILKPRTLGTGLLLYRFDMECNSVRTLLCHTKEEPSTRSILITLFYNLTEEEKKLKESLKKKLDNSTQQISFLEGKQVIFEDVSGKLNSTLIFEDETTNIGEKLKVVREEIKDLQKIWNKQNYYTLAKDIVKVEYETKETEDLFEEFNKSLSNTVSLYNMLIDDLKTTKENLQKINQFYISDNTTIFEINDVINNFNEAVRLFQEKSNIDKKEKLQQDITKKVEIFQKSIEEKLRKEVLSKELELDINYDILCKITENCIQHHSIKERANQSEFDLRKACDKIEELRDFFSVINQSVQEDFLKQSYPDEQEFWDNISHKVINLKQEVIAEYLEQLSENESNSALIRDLLIELPYIETGNYTNYNLTPAFVVELVNQQPALCTIFNGTLIPIAEVDVNYTIISESIPNPVDIFFEEPIPECCVFGKCENCCIKEECKNNPSNFPVVFLHGHAINKDTSAEYSLEGFNKIQKKLEEDGYLNAGTITLFSTKDSPRGIWGLPQVPMTIRASYYFDIFRQPENYIVVQTKSENIDTYAVRLKELIDIIKYKTGKSKVNIVAFSMGGLVARRYIQIFGSESVDKLILIGTPNKGIVGSIAEYCPITGEKLECGDMNSDSLFINKLNFEPLPNIPIYNIVGTGCRMGNKFGDGAVLEEKALLEGANNYIINGTCSKVKPLHLKLRDIDIYPNVYGIIKDALRKNQK